MADHSVHGFLTSRSLGQVCSLIVGSSPTATKFGSSFVKSIVFPRCCATRVKVFVLNIVASYLFLLAAWYILSCLTLDISTLRCCRWSCCCWREPESSVDASGTGVGIGNLPCRICVMAFCCCCSRTIASVSREASTISISLFGTMFSLSAVDVSVDVRSMCHWLPCLGAWGGPSVTLPRLPFYL